MKKLLLVMAILSSCILRAQYDSLLHVDFNDRYYMLDGKMWEFIRAGDSAGLVTYFDDLSAAALAGKDKSLALESEFFKLKFHLHNGSKDEQAVLAAHEELSKKARKQKNYIVLALTEFNLAEYYWINIANFEIGLEHFYKTYEHLQQIPDEEYRHKQYQTYVLGEKYYFFTDYNNALFYLHRALAVKNPEKKGPAVSINNTLGLAFAAMGQLDSAEYYYKEGIRLAEDRGDVGWVGNISGNLGGVYYKAGNYPKAIEWLRKDITISLSRNNQGSACGALMMLAAIDMESGNMELAEEKIDSAIIFLKGRSDNRLKALFPLLSKLYSYKGDWKLSALYLDSALMIRDTIAKKSNATQLLRAQQKADLEQHRAEMQKVEAKERMKTLERNVTIGGLLLALVGVTLIFRQKKRTDKARKRSDELLLNILPSDVATELKIKGESRARRFSEVTVLFSDFKDFTLHSETLGPEELVRILDGYFKAFDTIVIRHGLEKIKTVGDAYICACGLPNPDPHHAEKVVRVALEMQRFMEAHDQGWQLRIGIHSGPVVAGIVGIKKFAYDIWGDTVNTAARMEQNSLAGHINISRATYELVKDKISCTYRGKVTAKNKGEMDMYFVNPENI